MADNLSDPSRRPVRGPTLRDVASRADVSVWTVSNAFSNPGKVAPATRERVLAAAVELGYRGPHPAARSLATGRSRVLALVADGPAEPLLGDPAAAQVARGLLRACDRAGLSMLMTGELGRSAVDGVAVYRAPAPAAAPCPVVVVDGPVAAGAHPVGADVRGAGAQAAAHLRALGHRDVAVLAWPDAGERLEGVRDGWGDAGPIRVVHATAAGAAGRDEGELLARAALGGDVRPTAILALSDVFARAALDVAHWMGLSVPGDISVVGLDDLPGSDAVGLTSVLIPYGPLGELAGEALVALSEGAGPPPVPPLPTSLVIRRSSGPPGR